MSMQDLKDFAKVVLGRCHKLGPRDIYRNHEGQFVDFPEGSASSLKQAANTPRGFIGRYNKSAGLNWILEDLEHAQK